MVSPYAYAIFGEVPAEIRATFKNAPEPEVELIIEAVCAHFKVKSELIIRKGRRAALVQTRQIIMFLIKHFHPKIALTEIGRIMGGYDHSTVIHNIQRVNDLIDTEDDYMAMIRRLKNRLINLCALSQNEGDN